MTGKRLAELEELGDDAATVRPTLDHYTANFLRFVMGVACAGTAVAYCIFSFDKAELDPNGAVWFQLSAIPVVTALLRYALAVEVGEGARRRTSSCGTACCSSWGSSGSSPSGVLRG